MGILDGYNFDFGGNTVSPGASGGLLGMLLKNMPNLPQPGQQPGWPDALPPNAAPAVGMLPQQGGGGQPETQNPILGLLSGISGGISNLFSPSGSGVSSPGAAQPQAGLAPSAAAGPGLGDRLGAAWMGLGHGGLTSALGGLATGQRQDPQGLLERALAQTGNSPDMIRAAVQNPQYASMLLTSPQQTATAHALVQAGVPPAVAQAAALNPEVLKTIAPQLYTKPEFKTVKNALGEDIPIFANADKQTITYPTAAGGGPGGDANIGAMQQTFDKIEAARNQGASTDEMLKAIPNSLREGVKAMLSGGVIPSNLSNRGAARDLTLRFAHAVDPQFDESLIPARVALQKSYQGGGKNYQETLALNTVGGHLSRLVDAADALGNTGFKPWNWLKNQTTSAITGNPALVKFRNDLVTTQNELAKAYHGGHVSDSAFNAFNNSINEAQTPAELKAAIGELGGLLQSKITANETGYKAGMNGLPLPSQYRAINEEAKHSFAKIGQWVGDDQQQGAQAQAQQPGQPATLPPPDKDGWIVLPNGIKIREKK